MYSDYGNIPINDANPCNKLLQYHHKSKFYPKHASSFPYTHGIQPIHMVAEPLSDAQGIYANKLYLKFI